MKQYTKFQSCRMISFEKYDFLTKYHQNSLKNATLQIPPQFAHISTRLSSWTSIPNIKAVGWLVLKFRIFKLPHRVSNAHTNLHLRHRHLAREAAHKPDRPSSRSLKTIVRLPTLYNFLWSYESEADLNYTVQVRSHTRTHTSNQHTNKVKAWRYWA